MSCKLLLGALPVLMLFIPCVLAGAFVTESEWSNVTSVGVAAMALAQGGAMPWAFYDILCVMEREGDGLKGLRPEHAKVYEYSKRQEAHDELYMHLSCCGRLLIIGCISVKVLACWFTGVFASKCFNDFDVIDDMYAKMSEGGLDGNPLNIFKPLDVCSCFLAAPGVIIFLGYRRTVHADIRRWNGPVKATLTE